MGEKQTENFFDGADFDWDGYLAYRPTYSEDFYERIYEYHTSKHGRWDLAHDVGTGPANVAAVLADRFKNVVASDESGYHVAVAQKHLSSTANEKVTVIQCRAEDIGDLPGVEGSVDLVTAAECLPLLDAKEAISSFAKVLRPGGTLAIWFYGRPIFADEGQERSQLLHQKISQILFSKIGSFKGTPFEKAWHMMGSWFDNAHFPEEDFKDVKRIKWNSDRPITFLDDDSLDFQLEYAPRIREDEELEKITDRDLWAKEGDEQWVRGFLDHNMPWKQSDDPETVARVEELYSQLNVAMGGKGVKRRISWPVILMLATKR